MTTQIESEKMTRGDSLFTFLCGFGVVRCGVVVVSIARVNIEVVELLEAGERRKRIFSVKTLKFIGAG
jgi:hypothetical protein